MDGLRYGEQQNGFQEPLIQIPLTSAVIKPDEIGKLQGKP